MKQLVEYFNCDGREAVYLLDQEEDTHMVTLRGSGGPIVSGSTREEAIDKFREAMKLSDSVRKLLYFKKHGKFPDE